MKTWHGIVTPWMAERWLCKNITNRAINKKRVSSYASDMQNGSWADNGEPIHFDKNGMLINGQHRLSAVVESGCSVPMLVVFDVEKNQLYDRGRGRSARDTLLMTGMPSELISNAMVATVKLFIRITRGTKDTIIVSDLEIADFISSNEEDLWKLSEIINKKSYSGAKTLRVNFARAPVLAAILFAIRDGAEVERLCEFASISSTGICSSPEDTAAAVFRNDLIKTAASSSSTSQKQSVELAAEKAISDFLNRTPRLKTYLGTTMPSFDSHKILMKKGEKHEKR